VFALRAWNETDDPAAIVAELVGSAATAAIGDRTWARFLVELQDRLPSARFSRAAVVVGPLRAVKDDAEVAALRRAAAAADRVAADLQSGAIALVGRTEAEVSAELGRRLLAEGHHRVNFAIVASGPNAASPHHDPGSRRIGSGEVVLCDFGGTMLAEGGAGYCSDITRCVHTGEPPAEFAELYAVLHQAQAAGVAAARVGVACQDVDSAARAVITEAGYGDRFIRRASIDELPQLWNVIVGEMSLVGPRPALPHETEAWDPLLTQRLRVQPGITGMWQVNGRSETSFEDYTRLDLYYVDNWSLLTDLAILLKTVPVVLSSRGAT